MALSRTTLTSPILASDTTLPVTSTSGYVVGNPIRMDSEVSYIVSVPSTTSVVVRMRGSEGSLSVPHQALTDVITGNGQDFTNWPTGLVGQYPPSFDDVVTIGVNTAIIACPTKPTTFIINKATALSGTTLAAPPLASNGLQVKFISTTAAAHVITGATLFNNGITGVPWSTVTFAAFAGAGFIATAVNGAWDVNGIPIAAAVVLS